VNVLDPAIRDGGFVPPQETLAFPDALVIEAKSHRPVLDVQNDHRDGKRRERKERDDKVIGQQSLVRLRNG
jgi:hypothetical protein